MTVAIGTAELDMPRSRDARGDMLLSGAILPTLLRLTLPNLIALCSAAIVSIAETAYVGSLGVASLGGIALAFPIFMLMQMLSAGAMGGTVSGAVSRALGAGDRDRAEALALCSLVIAAIFGLVFTAAVRAFGPAVYRAMGGSGAVLGEALAFSNVAAWGITGIWLTNILASIARGSGNMVVPAATLLAAGFGQVVVGGVLGLGLGPFPRLGMAGVAAGQLAAFSFAGVFLLWHLRSGDVRLPLRFASGLLSIERFMDILRIGAVAMLSPLLSVAAILVLTGIVARFGPQALAGYGIGVRLEFLLIPIAFSVGVASVPMVGTAIGAANLDRARKIAWTAGGVAAVTLGLLGLVAGLFPWLWVDLFTSAPDVRDAAYAYLRIAAFGFAFFGLGLCLYFASQGAGRVGGAIVAQALRLAVIVIGGSMLVEHSAPLWGVFALSAGAMVTMGIGTALFVRLSRWE
ncbi:MAG TPA: MATE family efflux transporter [Sphingopyxis sp.]|uniref:MATE family efflux transporter n=1 Tax=Sphingopyxis sp. TaxID=1908224 RepID=UPI002E15CF2A|nr:MATE family efflux transporter [Sphingopyxis sp.]